MNHVIIGAGPAGVVAAETLHKRDPSARIVIIGDEPEPPYSRMAIPYLLMENIDESGTYLRKQEGHFSGQGIEVVVDTVESVDPAGKAVSLASGGRQDYDRLLVASGSRPIVPPIPGIDHARVTSCWTLEDARKISGTIRPGSSVVLIGAGFIGCIILEALVSSGAKLTVIEMGNRMVPRMLDQTCGTLLQRWCTDKGVNVMTGSQVEAIESSGDHARVKVSDGREVEAELVICATGVQGNAGFLADSGIEMSNGAIVINDCMRSSIEDIYAAGDVACGRDFSTGEYSVQAIQPTAVEHGYVAAANMVEYGSIHHQGSVLMNVLDTIGLISSSYGQWEGVDGGDTARLVDFDHFRYIQLQFEEDRLIGANTLGLTQHVGVIRGLVQGRFPLGKWKDRLIDNPLMIMEAWLAVTQG